MTRAILVMTVGTNVREMGPASVESANVIRAILELTVILSAQDMVRVITTLVTATVNGRVSTVRFQNAQTTALEMASATALFLHVSVTQGGVEMTVASLTAQVNLIVIIEAHAHR